jgi:MoaA/NifB/PqqE/SkfB family radical SAM enzyme
LTEREKVIWQLFGHKLISFRKLNSGEIVGTGLFNPILKRLGFVTMLMVQVNFFQGYKNLGTWKGKRVSNTFAPPLGSWPMVRLMIASIKGRILKRPSPVAMTFAVTYKCQCECVHCSAGRHHREDISELSTLEAKRVIDESQDLGISIIAFTGGEPLMRRDIFELIAYVNKRKAVPLLFTNGEFLTEENANRLAKAGLYSIFVSIDSPYPEEHDALRNKQGLFNKALKGIERMRKRGVLVGISSYATRSATEKGMYKKIYKLARERNLQNVMLFDGVPTGNMLKNTSEMLTIEQREEIRDFSSKLFKNSIIPPLSSQAWQNSIEGYLGGIGCLAGNIQYYVSAYGEVTPCDFTPLSFGSIREEALKKIWKKMVRHNAYNHRSTFCRMQNPNFRRVYIDPIPEDQILPYNIQILPNVDYRKLSF